MVIWRKFKEFRHDYDPANFYFIYSLKATLAIAINSILGYYFFGANGAALSINVTMGIFFLSMIETSERVKVAFLGLYILLSLAILPFIATLISLDTMLSFVVFVWIFFVTISSHYSENLNKILLITTGTALTGFVMYNTSGFVLSDAICGVALGGVSAIIIKFGAFPKYGSFTKKSVKTIVFELSRITNSLSSDEFAKVSDDAIKRIRELKNLFNSDSINLRDTRLIRNHSRAIFYVYELESIALLLCSLRPFFLNIKNKELLNKVITELDRNFLEILKFFANDKPAFRREIFDSISQSNYKLLASSLSMIYARLELIKKGNDDKIEFKKVKKTTLFECLKKINLSDETTLNALRLSVCMSIAIFISQATNINHGIWIAMAVMSLNRTNRHMLKTAGRENILGGLAGFCIGFLFVSVLGGSFALDVVAVFGIFCVYYLKNHRQLTYALAFMAELTIVYSLIKQEFLELIFMRLANALVGFLLVFAVYMLTLPNSTNELETRVQKLLEKLAKFINESVNKDSSFTKLQDEILNDLKDYKELTSSQKDTKWSAIYNKIIELNYDLINTNTYIIKYSLNKDIKLNADIALLSSRFEMISKKLATLPYFFMENFNLESSDKQILFMLKNIAKKQNELYLLTSL